jgi:hypothetical protein
MNLLYDERFSPAEIAHRVQSVGQRISSDFPESPIVLIAILKGAADLRRPTWRARFPAPSGSSTST